MLRDRKSSESKAKLGTRTQTFQAYPMHAQMKFYTGRSCLSFLSYTNST